ncbi:MAG TPA: NADH-quinone oxidoreductase subunit M, partial [Solirubrobacteraceae bacterium]|nr:NADH-quinone oxidoreductase subunit M [Solirubrobacteraceae bacterium]
MPPLSIILWLPLACALLGAALSLLGRRTGVVEHAEVPSGASGVTGDPLSRPSTSGVFALLGSLGALALAIGYIADYSPSSHGLEHVTDLVWISELGIHYKLGVDGLNVFMIGLTTLLFAAAAIAANLREWDRPRLFYFNLMLAESAVLGALLAQDLALFVAFFDLMLIPFYFLIGAWGAEPGRVKATIKLVIYTFVGSLLMLSAAVATGVLASQQGGGHITFVLTSLQHLPLSRGSQEWIFLFFAAAFLVKMPAFPLHGWMPDGYKAMPIEVLMVFSGVLSKVGAYGFLRIVLPLYPQAAAHFQTLMLLIALASIVYGSVVAFTQTDARLVAGYSSVAQLGFITLGIFSLNPQGAQGALLQMVNHGLVVAALLFIVALLARRAGGSEDIRDMGGIAFRAPVLATIFLIVALATLAMPGSSNFVGEFLILLGVFKAKLAIAIVAFTGVVLASVYALRLFIRAMHNRVGPKVSSRELSFRDGVVLVPLVAVIVFMA